MDSEVLTGFLAKSAIKGARIIQIRPANKIVSAGTIQLYVPDHSKGYKAAGELLIEHQAQHNVPEH